MEVTLNNTPEILDELRQELSRFPFDQPVRIEYLRQLQNANDGCLDAEMQEAALFVPDRSVLFYLGNNCCEQDIEGQKVEPRKKVESKPKGDRTAVLISNFLIEMPDDQPKRKLTLADAATDYAAYLEQQDEEEVYSEPAAEMEANETSEKPNAASSKLVEESALKAAGKNKGEDNVQNVDSGGHFTEALAKICIKQGKFEEAIEIIRRLNADNSTKSCYFADQIRFLEKVVINNKTKK